MPETQYITISEPLNAGLVQQAMEQLRKQGFDAPWKVYVGRGHNHFTAYEIFCSGDPATGAPVGDMFGLAEVIIDPALTRDSPWRLEGTQAT